MKHRASPRFWRAYRGLPQQIRQLADRSYKLLKENPSHTSLHFKNVGAFWSSRVGLHHRAIAVETGADFVWFWIGSHADYDKLLGRKPAKQRMSTAATGAARKRKPSRRG